MAPPQEPTRGGGRPRAKSPAERAEEAAGVQRRLKQEAAERRLAAGARQPPPVQSRGAGRRRTP